MSDQNRTDSLLKPWSQPTLKSDRTQAKKAPVESTTPLPPKLGKAIKLPVPDFSDPHRKLTCLEADFPIAQVNALSNLEGNAGKPIYQMSKWWARRRSSVFRSMLIAAATEAPEDRSEASKLVWDHYYCNHQKAGSFKKLKVLDCFMGGGTTLVEGSRLGMQMTGVDLNPVAWFVVKNELACSDPEQVKALFEEIERQVKPQIQPFYTTTCPRGHTGYWVDVESGTKANIDPIDLPPDQRSRYRWEGPEVIYTFWAKHGPCQAKGCGHRTPLFKSPLIAEKNLSTGYAELICPNCGTMFHADLGETRMAPGAERIVLESETPFTELSQTFAMLLNDYDKGKAADTIRRAESLQASAADEPGLRCPKCDTFSGKRLTNVLERHVDVKRRAAQRKKKDFKLKRKSVSMYLLIHPEWLQGANGFEDEIELGGWAGAPAEATTTWYKKRMDTLRIIEVRGESLPEIVTLADGTEMETAQGTVPRQAHFTCASCGREGNTLESVRPTEHTAPVAVYALQCHCPQCAAEGYTYGGRYFKAPDEYDIKRLVESEKEWASRMEGDLAEYWPHTSTNPYPSVVSDNDSRIQNMDRWNYNFWWKMFNPRQLLVHSHLLKTITEASEEFCPLDVREQALGAFQQYLRNQNMFCFWNQTADKMEPMMSNANYHPKMQTIENCVFQSLGRGNWQSSVEKCVAGMDWARNPWELVATIDEKTKSEKGFPEDPLIPGNEPYCGSSTDLSMLGNEQFDLVITDPPFGNNLFYADLSDFFYGWLRLPLRKWYVGLPEAVYFAPEFTPKSLEATDNKAEHPDDREDYEKDPFIESKHLARIQELSGDSALMEKAPNPLYRPEPSSDFYCQILSAVWAEAGRRLKDGGIMAFTFHHSEDQAEVGRQIRTPC